MGWLSNLFGGGPSQEEINRQRMMQQWNYNLMVHQLHSANLATVKEREARKKDRDAFSKQQEKDDAAYQGSVKKIKKSASDQIAKANKRHKTQLRKRAAEVTASQSLQARKLKGAKRRAMSHIMNTGGGSTRAGTATGLAARGSVSHSTYKPKRRIVGSARNRPGVSNRGRRRPK